MQGIVKKGPRLQFRQAEEKDLDYILEVEFRPENGRFVIPWEREVHSQTLNTEGAIHLVIERIDTLEPVGFLMIAAEQSVEGDRVDAHHPRQEGRGLWARNAQAPEVVGVRRSQVPPRLA